MTCTYWQRWHAVHSYWVHAVVILTGREFPQFLFQVLHGFRCISTFKSPTEECIHSLDYTVSRKTVCETLSSGESASAMCRNTGGSVALHPTKSASFGVMSVSLNSSSVRKIQVLKELTCWQKAGQTESFKSNASLTGFSFSGWSSAR